MRSTREIDTPHGRMLFSPVLAHALEPGDTVSPWYMTAGVPWRVGYVADHRDENSRRTGDLWVGLITQPGYDPVPNRMGRNDPVLRAVGAGRSRGGMR